MNFTDKNILVVGGSSGIGFRIVQDLVKNNVNVYTASRTENPDFASMNIMYTYIDVSSDDVSVPRCNVSLALNRKFLQ